MFFVPSNRDQGVISNFSKWEQAFRVYSNIYTWAHPDRAAELMYITILFSLLLLHILGTMSIPMIGSLEPI